MFQEHHDDQVDDKVNNDNDHKDDYNEQANDENGMVTLSGDLWLTLHSQRGFQDRSPFK